MLEEAQDLIASVEIPSAVGSGDDVPSMSNATTTVHVRSPAVNPPSVQTGEEDPCEGILRTPLFREMYSTREHQLHSVTLRNRETEFPVEWHRTRTVNR